MAFPYISVYDLPAFQFIAGTSQTLNFSVFTSACATVNLSGYTSLWELLYFGSSTSAISASGTYSGSITNTFVVELLPDNTRDLSGKFTQRHTVTTGANKVYKSQGIVNII